MGREKLLQVKRGLEFLLSELSPSARLALIVFDNKPDVLLPLTRMTDENKVRASAIVQGVHAQGGTMLGRAVKLARALLERRTHHAEASAVLVLSDGVSSDRVDEEDRSSSTFAFGYGADHDPQVMRALGQAGYAFIEHAEGFANAVADCLAPVVDLAATDCALVLEASAGAAELTRSSLGALAFEACRDVLFTVRPGGAPCELVARVQYSVGGSRQTAEARCEVGYGEDVPSEGRDRVMVEMWRAAAVQALEEVATREFDGAMTAIEQLLGEIRAAGSSPELAMVARDLERALARLHGDRRTAERTHTAPHASEMTLMAAYSGSVSHAVRAPTTYASATTDHRRNTSALYSSGTMLPMSVAAPVPPVDQ